MRKRILIDGIMTHPHVLPVALLICDDIAKVTFFKRTLKGAYYVMDAKEAHMGLEWLKDTPVEIIILDYSSLDEPLVNLCTHIRKMFYGKTVPILLISNKIKKSFTLQSLNAGVSDFIHEPLEAQEIYERIAVSLRSKLVNKKMSYVTDKIKKTSMIPKNTRTFLNRVLLSDKALDKISEEKKVALPLSLLLIHLDNMQKIKESLGEQVLEEVLHSLQIFLEKKLRHFDTLLSQGTGRYLLLLPKTSPTAASMIAEDIRKEISTTMIVTNKKQLLVTVSIGLVPFDKKLTGAAQSFEQFDLCYRRVQKALGKAKKSGNTIIFS